MDSSFEQVRRTAVRLFFFLTTAGGLASCESMVAVVPESEIGVVSSKLTVHSYISPQDTVIRVAVTESVPAFGESNDQAPVDNARVRLSDGRLEVNLNYDPTTGIYSLPAEGIDGIHAGNTYKLRVEHNQRVVEASTTVPAPPPAIASYTVNTSYIGSFRSFGRQDTMLAVQFSWKDLPGTENYYRVAGGAELTVDYVEVDEDGNQVTKRSRSKFPLNWEGSFGRSEFQSDVNADGQMMQSPMGLVRLSGRTIMGLDGVEHTDKPVEINFVRVYLLHTDRHYYNYHRSIEARDFSGDNPFAEPTLLYTNVDGGLGIFASYNSFSTLL